MGRLVTTAEDVVRRWFVGECCGCGTWLKRMRDVVCLYIRAISLTPIGTATSHNSGLQLPVSAHHHINGWIGHQDVNVVVCHRIRSMSSRTMCVAVVWWGGCQRCLRQRSCRWFRRCLPWLHSRSLPRWWLRCRRPQAWRVRSVIGCRDPPLLSFNASASQRACRAAVR